MNWINIHVSLLHAPEFLGCDPVARATWLSVLGHSVEQENGGRVAQCLKWKDRQWQQTCGVTLEEINASAPLLSWDGEDLVVWRYPLAHQVKVETNRKSGRAGGQSKSQAKAEAARLNGAKRKPSADPSESEALTQRNSKSNSNSKEREVGADVSAPSDAEWLKGLETDPAYVGIHVQREFGKMTAWCAVNRKQPSRRRFINWLNRAERPMAATGTQDTFGSVRPNLGAW